MDTLAKGGVIIYTIVFLIIALSFLAFWYENNKEKVRDFFRILIIVLSAIFLFNFLEFSCSR